MPNSYPRRMKLKVKKKCDYCGRKFVAFRTTQRFCSGGACTMAYWSRVRSEGDRAFRQSGGPLNIS